MASGKALRPHRLDWIAKLTVFYAPGDYCTHRRERGENIHRCFLKVERKVEFGDARGYIRVVNLPEQCDRDDVVGWMSVAGFGECFREGFRVSLPFIEF